MQVTDLDYSQSGEFLVAAAGSDTVMIYRRVGDGYIPVAIPSGTFSSYGLGVAFSKDSLTLAFATSGAPYLSIFRVEYNTNTQFKLPTQTVDGLGLLGYIKT